MLEDTDFWQENIADKEYPFDGSTIDPMDLYSEDDLIMAIFADECATYAPDYDLPWTGYVTIPF
jgi:hypothetical protein